MLCSLAELLSVAQLFVKSTPNGAVRRLLISPVQQAMHSRNKWSNACNVCSNAFNPHSHRVQSCFGSVFAGLCPTCMLASVLVDVSGIHICMVPYIWYTYRASCNTQSHLCVTLPWTTSSNVPRQLLLRASYQYRSKCKNSPVYTKGAADASDAFSAFKTASATDASFTTFTNGIAASRIPMKLFAKIKMLSSENVSSSLEIFLAETSVASPITPPHQLQKLKLEGSARATCSSDHRRTRSVEYLAAETVVPSRNRMLSIL
jgi:hypothetical protein